MHLLVDNKLLKSLKWLDQSIQDDPYKPSRYSNKAGVLRMLGRHQKGLETLQSGYKMVVSLHGEDYPDLYVIKQGFYHLLKALGCIKEDKGHMTRAIALKPLPKLYSSISDDQDLTHKEVLELREKALKLDLQYMPSFCLRYHTSTLLGDWDKMECDHDQV